MHASIYFDTDLTMQSVYKFIDYRGRSLEVLNFISILLFKFCLFF